MLWTFPTEAAVAPMTTQNQSAEATTILLYLPTGAVDVWSLIMRFNTRIFGEPYFGLSLVAQPFPTAVKFLD